MNPSREMMRGSRLTLYFGMALLLGEIAHPARARAPNPQLQRRLAEVKQALARNAGSLARYSWPEQQIGSLAPRYAQPEPGKLQLSYEQGSITVGSGGAQGEVRLVIQNDLKQGDAVTLVFNKGQRSVVSIQVSSYLDDPKDDVSLSGQYAQLRTGRIMWPT